MINLLTTFLAEYWLEALLAVSGAVTLCGLFYNQIKLKRYISAVEDDAYRAKRRANEVGQDFHDLSEKFKALDKPSNDKALENIAVILKKKISKQPTKLIRPKAKANGRSHAQR